MKKLLRLNVNKTLQKTARLTSYMCCCLLAGGALLVAFGTVMSMINNMVNNY